MNDRLHVFFKTPYVEIIISGCRDVYSITVLA